MTEDSVQSAPAEVTHQETDPDRPRRSRKRGKRNRSRPIDGVVQEGSPTAHAPSAEATQPAQPRERSNRRSTGSRSGQYGFADGLDRFVCVYSARIFPQEWPVNHRRGLAIVPLREVGRRERELLVCDRLHQGECFWPDGEPAQAAATVDSVNETPSEHADSTVNSPAEVEEMDAGGA